jgi:hypothetical protein
MASSIVGALESWNDKGLVEELLWDDLGVSVEELAGIENAQGSNQHDGSPVAYGSKFDLAELEAQDSKYRPLSKFLKAELTRNPTEKFVVFAFFRGTLKYLKRRLAQDGIEAALLMGDMETPSEDILELFTAPDGPSVLLSSEVGSEGIDLQFCRFVVNYDLPWNPMRVEQRIGRLDRLGQKADRISIANLYVSNTIEDRILQRLYDRINVFRESIGDIEEILGGITEMLIVEFFDPTLSDAERERRSADAALSSTGDPRQYSLSLSLGRRGPASTSTLTLEEARLTGRGPGHLVESLADLGPRHAADGAVQADVLAARQLRVEAGAHLQEACHPALDGDVAGAWLGDAREDLEERGLAGTVAADDTHHLTTLDLEGDVLQCPELLNLGAGDQRTPTQDVGGRAGEAARAAGDDVAQRGVALPVGLVADQVFLAQALGADDDIAHGLGGR